MEKAHKPNGSGSKVVLVYVPVLHEGYRRFFERHSDCDRLILIGAEIIKAFKPLAKDLRALPPETMKTAIDSLGYFEEIKVADFAMLDSLNVPSISIVMPDEDIMHELHDKHFTKAKAEYDSIFLRWDKHKSFEGKPVEADQTISKDEFDRKMMKELRSESQKSPEFWRQIGAAVVKDGEVILKTYNQAVPDKMLPYTEGDPRSDFSKGINVELSTAFHCEAHLVAEAAKKGISLEGASMYVTTFPCPPCAKLIAYSGIKKLYYADGYGVLDGERVLKSQGVEIVFVKME